MFDLKPRLRVIKRKSRAQYEALERLNRFLNKENPRLARLLVRFWGEQQNAMTYKELREAFLRGGLTVKTIQTWIEDYAQFFNEYLKPSIMTAVTQGGAETLAGLTEGAVYDPFITGIENWVTTHGGEWITLMSNESQEAVQGLIRFAADGQLGVDEMSRLTRPLIGLNERQAKANARFYANRKQQYIQILKEQRPKATEKQIEREAQRRARESAVRYATRQHRQRAMMIAETEMSFAYNKGGNDAVKQMVKEGILPSTIKPQWSTAADELVCDDCGALDGVIIDLGDEFDFKARELYEGSKETPPAHPRCRCALCYIEGE